MGMTFGQLFTSMNPNVTVVENGTCVWLYYDSVNYHTMRMEWWNKEIPADALTLLKAQEPRVMTKEEIIGWDGYIWFEFNGMKAMKTVLIDHGMVREPFRGDYPTKELSWGTCQETWRAWTARPTDEQRKAVKWDV